jgi:hypothetical protein
MSAKPTDSVAKTSSNHLNRQIAQYSVAAAVAGVSLLALASPASGEVVVTRKTIPVPVGTASSPQPLGISLANNGVLDVSFTLSQSSFNPGRTALVKTPDRKNGVTIGGSFDPYARALARGAKIGPNADSFLYAGLVEFSATSNGAKYCKGYWASNLQNKFFGCGDTKNKYIGVRFSLNGQTHFGWIRLTVTTNSDLNGPPLTATVTGYAYETVANKPILAGTAGTTAAAEEKSSAEARVPKDIQSPTGPSLGMLVAGSESMPLWRREESLAAK